MSFSVAQHFITLHICKQYTKSTKGHKRMSACMRHTVSPYELCVNIDLFLIVQTSSSLPPWLEQQAFWLSSLCCWFFCYTNISRYSVLRFLHMVVTLLLQWFCYFGSRHLLLFASSETQVWDPLEDHWGKRWEQLHFHRPHSAALQWEVGVPERQAEARFAPCYPQFTQTYLNAHILKHLQLFI